MYPEFEKNLKNDRRMTVVAIALLLLMCGSALALNMQKTEQAEVKLHSQPVRNSRQRRLERQHCERRERLIERHLSPYGQLKLRRQLTPLEKTDIVSNFGPHKRLISHLSLFLALGLAAILFNQFGPSLETLTAFGLLSITREWTFLRDIQPGSKKQNPQTGREFEKLGKIHATAGDPIQNSLDAHDGGDDPVLVELGIHDGDHCLPRREVEPYFGLELRRHIKGNGNEAAEISQGERLPTFEEDCSFITLEDFYTVGLQGRVDQYDPAPPNSTVYSVVAGHVNRFLWFFRAQNATSTDHERLGSWGEGKFTLEAASRLGAQIGWSIRKSYSSIRQVLMGQTTLRWHTIFAPDDGFGWTDTDGTASSDRFDAFGTYSTSTLTDTGIDYAPLPITDDDEILAFRKTFRMLRKTEPGLSILIPYPHEELLDSARLARAVIARWFLAIHSGKLVVRIRHNGDVKHELSAAKLRSEISGLDWKSAENSVIGSKDEPNPSYRDAEQWLAALDIYDWAQSSPAEGHFTTNPTGGGVAPTWVNPLSEDDMTALRERYNAGSNVMLTVRPKVTRAGDNSTQGEFTIIMQKAPGELATQFYAREGMIVPFMKHTDGVLAIILCDSTDLRHILRDSEGPAHLSWNPGAPRVRHKAYRWEHGYSTVKYVVHSLKELRALMKFNEPIESHPFKEFIIKIPAANTGGLVTAPPTGTTITTVPKPPPPPTSKKTSIASVSSKGSQGKIRIRRRKVKGSLLPTAGKVIEVNLAYVNHRRNSWSSYREFDFTAADITATKTEGVRLISSVAKPTSKRGLVMTFAIDQDDWAIDLEGFGTSRDIAVDVYPVKVVV